MAILITHPISGKVMGSFTSPPWVVPPDTDDDNEELHMPLPLFLTLCGLLPFLLVSLLHVTYAYRCWPRYAQGLQWLGLLVLNLLVLVPYLNVVAFPVALLWLILGLLRCGRTPDAATWQAAARAVAASPAVAHTARSSSHSSSHHHADSSSLLNSADLSLEA